MPTKRTRTPPLHVQLKRARMARGMTRSQIEDRCEFPREHVKGIECNDWAPSTDHLLRICRALNCYCIIGGPGGAYVVEENQDVRR